MKFFSFFCLFVFSSCLVVLIITFLITTFLAPPDDQTICVKCAIGKYQEKKNADVWGCKTCPRGYEHTSEDAVCRMCVVGQYQNENTRVNSNCKTCCQGRDAPNKENECVNCVNGRFQEKAISTTYGCNAMINSGVCSDDEAGASLVDGSDVESGKLTIRMFKGACCQGRPTATQILFLNECLLDNQGSVKV